LQQLFFGGVADKAEFGKDGWHGRVAQYLEVGILGSAGCASIPKTSGSHQLSLDQFGQLDPFRLVGWWKVSTPLAVGTAAALQ